MRKVVMIQGVQFRHTNNPTHRGTRHGWGGGRPVERHAATPEEISSWFTGRLPDNWFVTSPTVTVDKEEIVVIGELPALEGEFSDDAAQAAAEAGRIARFREDTRHERMEIARHAEHQYGRKVSWGVEIGNTQELYTHQSVPVMTRLKQPERMVLDTLVDAGVAKSRSEALGWAVRLVGQHTTEWLDELREAMTKVDELRSRGPAK